MDRNKYVVQCRKVMGVALRKESVDRNSIALASMRVSIMVALRKESVDRNKATTLNRYHFTSRSPQGERG